MCWFVSFFACYQLEYKILLEFLGAKLCYYFFFLQSIVKMTQDETMFWLNHNWVPYLLLQSELQINENAVDCAYYFAML